MQLFRIVGSTIGGLFAMAVGAVWLAMAYYLSAFSSFGTMPTVIGLCLLGGLVFIGGLVGFIRGLASTTGPAPLPEGSTDWRDTGERSESDSGFDPDAAIARYLETRPAPESVVEPRPPRPSFGRKQV